jgi:hypothetical protein
MNNKSVNLFKNGPCKRNFKRKILMGQHIMASEYCTAYAELAIFEASL